MDCGLTFAGFLAITCPLKQDSKMNISCLHSSSQHVRSEERGQGGKRGRYIGREGRGGRGGEGRGGEARGGEGRGGEGRQGRGGEGRGGEGRGERDEREKGGGR